MSSFFLTGHFKQMRGTWLRELYHCDSNYHTSPPAVVWCQHRTGPGTGVIFSFWLRITFELITHHTLHPWLGKVSRSVRLNWPHIRVKVDLAVIVIKGYFTLPRAPQLKPHHRIQFRITPTKRYFFAEYRMQSMYSSPTDRASGTQYLLLFL